MKNIGVDLTKISRFVAASDSFAQRILSPAEYSDYLKITNEKKALFLARAWAIKEAIFKANNSYFSFSKIELQKINHRWTFKNFSISISHDGDDLIAFVIEN
ncbi:holo-ACP synthase [Mycoplasmopsis gallopavonis]|uniref:Holo-[acyl-carrier protein]synthase n=1 Tax=Mycoplasmopsis gallopavonis TaxID=76629 RepID=A0A449AZ41_9BACT|nr:4'-phosphopantetheinyl transferase superfamily protein [Mycoplasmopsis gallopavonis]RIV16979.1 ACP synthase [Mycoplasmopsis gallopavonis]VEU72771.1 Holo-[acyl-carrier protein]synthase [Mycoplasmopsis gallopavonis]